MKKYSYQWLLLFTILSLLGLAVLPKLAVQLMPSDEKQTLTVAYHWPGASPIVMERQVTVKLEGILGTVPGVEKIRSVSGYQYGYVTVEMDRKTDPDEVRIEVAALIRQVYPGLPREVTYPLITLNTPDEHDQQKPLLTLQLSGPATTATLQRYAEEQLKPRLATVEGLYTIEIYGGNREEWVLTYDADQLTALRLTENDLRQALVRYFRREPMGQLTEGNKHTLRVGLEPSTDHSPTPFAAIPVRNRTNRIVYLTDLVTITRQEPPAESFYRINGQTAVNLVVVADAGANHLAVAHALHQQIASLSLPPGYRIDIGYDSTIYIRSSLQKLAIQLGVAVAVLLLFVAFATRSWWYMAVIISSSVVTLLVSVVLFWLLHIEIHLYSLAALTTSLGILIDNTIVMIDHYRRYRTLQIFSALLGATLTTCSGGVVVWFLPEENRLALTDFAQVMSVTLSVSLFVAMGFIPAVMEQSKWLKTARKDRMVVQQDAVRRQLAWSQRYEKAILFFSWYRRWFYAAVILAFGLPVFGLPNQLNANHPLAVVYNSTLGSDWYTENLKPIVNQWLGGSLRLFVHFVYEGSYQTEPERTALYVIAELPNQSMPEQMNEIFRRFESDFRRYREVDQFITQIANGQEGSLVIYFRKPYDQGVFPYQLKNRAIALSAEMSGIDWDIFGVGQGFSQQSGENSTPTFTVELLGYNYRQLEEQALLLQQQLEKHPRIQEVNINRSPGLFQRKNLYEYVFQTDSEKLARHGLSNQQLYERLADLDVRPQPDQYELIQGTYEPITIRPFPHQLAESWRLSHQPLRFDSLTVKLNDVGTNVKQKVMPEIQKVDQQYRRVVSFEYFGSYSFGEKFLKQTLDELRPRLPLGYTAKVVEQSWLNTETSRSYWLIGLIFLLIYLIGAVIFENLWQPLALIGLIPLSYIGAFGAFYGFEVNFDEGGYAAFILLAGNVVCAGIFLVAELNRLLKIYPHKPLPVLYVKAFQHKIQPILLTILSTVVGMIPFLLYEQEPFWYALGIGTIGGLLMSIPAIFIYLPIFLIPGKSQIEFNQE